MASFLIIGGGFIGAAAALRLRAAGFKATLVDPGEPRRAASFGNAGAIAAEQVEPLASAATLASAPGLLFGLGGPLDFRWRDIGLWAPWAVRFIAACPRFEAGVEALSGLMENPLAAWERLMALAGARDLLAPGGHALVWMSARRAKAGMAAWARARTGAARFREMRADELAAYTPGLATAPAAGLRFSGTGQVREPQAAREALLAAFEARGGVRLTSFVRDLAADELGVRAALADGQILHADQALVAAGAWSGALLRQLATPAPLIAERGYALESAAAPWPAHLPATVFEERALVLTRFSSGLRATSFLEFGAPDAPPDSRKWGRLARHLRALGIAFPTPTRWMGPRPTLPDYLPAIGRLERAPRVLYAFGHQHLGLTNAAATAEIVETLARGAAPTIDIAPFRIERFH